MFWGWKLAEYEISLRVVRVTYSPFRLLPRSKHDIPRSTGVPALATDEVTTRLPADAVRATSLVRVSDRRLAIGPPREEVTIVGAFLVGRDLTLAQAYGRRGHDTSNGGAGREEGGEGNHLEDFRGFEGCLAVLILLSMYLAD